MCCRHDITKYIWTPYILYCVLENVSKSKQTILETILYYVFLPQLAEKLDDKIENVANYIKKWQNNLYTQLTDVEVSKCWY